MEKIQMKKDRSIHKIDINMLWHFVKFICRGLAAFLAGISTAWWLIPFANTQRGYTAFGGEWLIVAIISIVVFKCCNWLFKKV